MSTAKNVFNVLYDSLVFSISAGVGYTILNNASTNNEQLVGGFIAGVLGLGFARVGVNVLHKWRTTEKDLELEARLNGESDSTELIDEISMRTRLEYSENKLHDLRNEILVMQRDLKNYRAVGDFVTVIDECLDLFGCVLNEQGYHFMILKSDSAELVRSDSALPESFYETRFDGKYLDSALGFLKRDFRDDKTIKGVEYSLTSKLIVPRIGSERYTFVLVKDNSVSSVKNERKILSSDSYLQGLSKDDPMYIQKRKALELARGFAISVVKADNLSQLNYLYERIHGLMKSDRCITGYKEAQRIIKQFNGNGPN